MKDNVGVESGPTTIPGLLVFNDKSPSKMSVPFRVPPSNVPSSSNANAATSVLGSSLVSTKDLTFSESSPAS